MAKGRVIVLRTLAAIAGLISLFFVFYTGRLLWVTRGLTAVRAEGKGAYAGAVAFPLLAALFALVARRLMNAKPDSDKPIM